MKKRGQLSIFIILGLVVLLSALLFWYFRSTTTILTTTPEEQSPVRIYVESCLERTMDDALTLVSQQGGFISLPLTLENDPSASLNPDGLGILHIPYWFRERERISPTPASVEVEMERYLTAQMPACLQDFSAFPQFTIVELEPLVADVSLNRRDVTATLAYPLRVHHKANNTYTVLDRFTYTSDVRLRTLLETANRLLDAELESFWLENFTLDLMASNPAVPFTDMAFSCRPLRWEIEAVRSAVAKSLADNLPRIRVLRTDHLAFDRPDREYEAIEDLTMEDVAAGNVPSDTPPDLYEWLRMTWDIGLAQDEPIIVGIVPGGELEMLVRPSEDGVMRSQLAQGDRDYLSLLCVQTWHFVYDLHYPVLVQLVDGISGYDLQFAMPVTLKNNEPYKDRYAPDLFGLSVFDRGFCEDTGDDLVDVRAYGKEDGILGLELSDAEIALRCLRYTCPLGMTGPDQGTNRLVTALPRSCQNPFLEASKDGYLPGKAQADGNRVSIDLTALKEVALTADVHRYNTVGDVVGPAEAPGPDMQVVVELVSDDHAVYAILPGTPSALLIDGDVTYDASIMLIEGEEYVGGWQGSFTSTGIDTASTLVVPALRFMPTPLTDQEKIAMIETLRSGIDDVTPALR